MSKYGPRDVTQKFALWQAYTTDTGALVSGTTVNSGALTAAQWNYVR